MASNRADLWGQEGHGFAYSDEKSSGDPSIAERGLLVCYSRKSSIFYTKDHNLVIHEGDARQKDLELGDSARFEMMPAASPPFRFKVVRSSLTKIPDIFKLIMEFGNNELYIRVRAYLTPDRQIFECEHVGDVKLSDSRTTLKLYKSPEFIEKSRLKIGHRYDVYVKFSADDLAWEFDCVDPTAHSFQLEEEDEIDRYKRRNKEAESSQSRRSEFDRFDRSGQDSIRSESTYRGSNYDLHNRETPGQLNRSRSQYENRGPSRTPSYAPSIVSGTTQNTATTLTDKEKKALQKENNSMKLMLKNVWAYKDVQSIIRDDNPFLYESVDDWLRNVMEEESES